MIAGLLRRRSWLALVALVGTVSAFWVSGVGRAFGPTHEGRINGRFALHVRNFVEQGFVGSHYLAGWEPYGDFYAQHPPLPHFVQAGVSVALGTGEVETRIFPMTMGVVAILAAFALVRQLNGGVGISVLAVVLVVSTPIFWLYAPLLWDVPILYLVPVTALFVVRARSPTWRSSMPFALVCGWAVLSSYICAAFAGTFWLWTLWRRRRRGGRVLAPPLLAAGATIVVAFGLTILWQDLAGNSGHLASSVSERAFGGDVSFSQYVSRMRLFLQEMYSAPMLLVAAIGLPRTWRSEDRRDVLVVSLLPVAAIIIGFPYGAFIHEYWSYPALVPLTLLCLSGLETMAELPVLVGRPRLTQLGSTAFGAVLILAVALGPIVQARIDQSDAGVLARRSDPPASQTIAWTDDGTARWLAYYWDLPPVIINPDDARANDSDLVLLRRQTATRLHVSPAEFLDRQGDFVLVRVGAVGSHL